MNQSPSGKLLLALLACGYCSVLFAAANPVVANNDDEAWTAFKIKFNKNYQNATEEEFRKQVFLNNKQFIESHNLKQAGFSFTQGLNPLSDLSTEEINRSRNGFRLTEPLPEQPLQGLLEQLVLAFNASLDHSTGSNATFQSRAWYENLLTRPKLDWRASGRVSKVKDQGSCGSCWSFATTGALEGILASRQKSVLLSEQNLVDCSRNYGNYGCNGGLMDAALRYVRDQGIMASQEYPYTGKDESCKFVSDKSVLRVRGSALLPPGNEQLLRIALAISGPIPVAIDASARTFHSYKSGVYDDTACRSSSNALNHAVLLVGYGTDNHAGDFWIIKNSWGNKWGDNGYIKMARNKHNLCGVATYAVLPLP